MELGVRKGDFARSWGLPGIGVEKPGVLRPLNPRFCWRTCQRMCAGWGAGADLETVADLTLEVGVRDAEVGALLPELGDLEVLERDEEMLGRVCELANRVLYGGHDLVEHGLDAGRRMLGGGGLGGLREPEAGHGGGRWKRCGRVRH